MTLSILVVGKGNEGEDQMRIGGKGQGLELWGLHFQAISVVVKSIDFVDLYTDASYAIGYCVGSHVLNFIFLNASLIRSIAQYAPSLLQYSLLSKSDLHVYPPPHLLSPHQNLTRLSPPILSPLFNSDAISTLKGLSTSGYASNWWIASNVDVSVYAGDHDVFKRSRQISPVLKSTFGWQIGVVKVILGGARG